MHDPYYSLLWRQSFSLDKKALLKRMDKDDYGCRHELLRIVKSIVKWQRTSLRLLESYHVKSAFVHYFKKNRDDWDSRNSRSLGKHSLGFLRELHSLLEEGNLPIHWHPEVNLLDEKTPVVLENMANRLKRILNSEAEIDRMLSSRINGESVTQEASSYISHLIVPVNTDGEMFGLLQVFLKFVAACISLMLTLTSVVLFCFLILIFFAIIIVVLEKAKSYSG